MDEILHHFKKPWNDDSLVNTNKQAVSTMVSKWCEMNFATIHSITQLSRGVLIGGNPTLTPGKKSSFFFNIRGQHQLGVQTTGTSAAATSWNPSTGPRLHPWRPEPRSRTRYGAVSHGPGAVLCMSPRGRGNSFWFFLFSLSSLNSLGLAGLDLSSSWLPR